MAENPVVDIEEEKVAVADEEEELLARHRKEKKDVQGSPVFRNYIFFAIFIYFFVLIIFFSNSQDSGIEEDGHKGRQEKEERCGRGDC